MFLPAEDLPRLVALRHALHQHPEVSGEERETARRVADFLRDHARPDALLTGLGGHGVAAVYAGAAPGETLLLRCELDALPIEEHSTAAHRSRIPGKGHLCGHDGHATILTAVATALARARPACGRVVLLFQPAEEDGSGAAAVIADPAFAPLRPDMALSLHNMPGLALGHAELKAGPVNCASRGLRLQLTGRTAHASQPETGVSPMQAVATLMPALTALSCGTQADQGFRLVTVTHARLGEPAFGIAPGAAEIWVTLRTLTDAGMADLCASAEGLARQVAEQAGLGLAMTWHDIFHHCENAPEAVAVLAAALDAEGIPWSAGSLPMRASEDFGRFGALCPSAMVFLGAGETRPALHNPDYDFPDALIAPAANLLLRAVRQRFG
ncbi:amidohydrolase [Pannonibacter tanglangensis]|uniref:Amidohydrolase n=1 Tax=Pannonibacter tanglangensis TaxID=2750084 RepID=A0ABW9ZH86_9HYPH|nr:amidohydrolase [Pannonibacter sp. XCT-34]NBN63307.1 amidohydrolase [Pannonibacter sp. XCT-34]